MNLEIDPNKYYSARQAAKLITGITCEPILQRKILEDMAMNNNNKFKAIIIKRNKNKRYFIKGSTIIELNTTNG